MARKHGWAGRIARLAEVPARAGASLARELGITLSQLQALALLVGDDHEQLRQAALRLKGSKSP